MSHADLLLKGGTVLDPSRGIHAVLDVAVVDGVISNLAPDLVVSGTGEILDVQGKTR